MAALIKASSKSNQTVAMSPFEGNRFKTTKPPFDRWFVQDALSVLQRQKTIEAEVAAIRSNPALMRALGQYAKQKLAEEAAERKQLTELAAKA